MENMNRVQVDLVYCDRALLRSKEAIQQYVLMLTKALNSERIDDIKIASVEKEKQSYHVMSQFLENALITGFFISSCGELSVSVYGPVDLDSQSIVDMTIEFFKGDVQ